MCDQYNTRHSGDCVVCYKCKTLGHISTDSSVKVKACFTRGEEWHMKVECPKAEKQTLRIRPTKPKGRNYQMILDEADVVA